MAFILFFRSLKPCAHLFCRLAGDLRPGGWPDHGHLLRDRGVHVRLPAAAAPALALGGGRGGRGTGADDAAEERAKRESQAFLEFFFLFAGPRALSLLQSRTLP